MAAGIVGEHTATKMHGTAQYVCMAQVMLYLASGGNTFKPPKERKPTMLYTIAVILLALWVLGLATSYTLGGVIHILLVLAVIAVIYQVITGRKVG